MRRGGIGEHGRGGHGGPHCDGPTGRRRRREEGGRGGGRKRGRRREEGGGD